MWWRDDVILPEWDPTHWRLDAWTLLVRNFSLPTGGQDKMVRYECRVGGDFAGMENQEFMRSFNISLAEGKVLFAHPLALYTLPIFLAGVGVGLSLPSLIFTFAFQANSAT
jgi:hypothetical protein